MSLRIFVSSDIIVRLDELTLSSTGAYANTATVTCTLSRDIATNGAMTAGDATLTSASNPWVSGDVGKTIVVKGAGTDGSDLRTTIASFTSAGSVELTAAAVVSVSSAIVAMSLANAQDVSMSYVSASDGRYQGTLETNATGNLAHGGNYWLEVTAAQGSANGFWRVPVRAFYQDDQV